MDKKGQAAMEFLMTYGWAILAAIVAIGALAYLGVFNPGRLVQDAVTVSAPFGAKAAVINTGNIQIELMQNLGETITMNSITVSGCGTLDATTTPAITPTLTAGTTTLYTVVCAAALTPDDAFKGDLTIAYTRSGSTLELRSTGTVAGKVR